MKRWRARLAACAVATALVGCAQAPGGGSPPPSTSPAQTAPDATAGEPGDPVLRGIRPGPPREDPAARPPDPQREEPGVGVGGLMHETGAPR